MKKITALLLAFAITTPSAFAGDNFEEYNKYVYRTLLPESGVCNINASFIGHEVEYPDVNDYFKGLISAYNFDLNNDGSDELITVESKKISIYTVNGEQAELCTSTDVNLIGNTGDSYANIFIKKNDGKNYLGIETFFTGEGQDSYQLEIFSLEGKELVSKSYIYQLNDNGEIYQSVASDGTSIFSHTEGDGIMSTVDPDNYVSIFMAAKNSLNALGINSDFLKRADKLSFDSEEYDIYHRLSDVLSDISQIAYINSTGVRTSSKPVVYFQDNSRLNDFLAPVYDVTVQLNGKEIDFIDQKPVIINGRTLVPVRAIFEAIGAEVSWLPDGQKIIANTSDTNITMTIGKSEYFVNGEKKILDVAPMIKNDRTLVPARASAEGFGYNVDWDASTKTVLITN